jgi:hypothetical protein
VVRWVAGGSQAEDSGELSSPRPRASQPSRKVHRNLPGLRESWVFNKRGLLIERHLIASYDFRCVLKKEMTRFESLDAVSGVRLS